MIKFFNFNIFHFFLFPECCFLIELLLHLLDIHISTLENHTHISSAGQEVGLVCLCNAYVNIYWMNILEKMTLFFPPVWKCLSTRVSLYRSVPMSIVVMSFIYWFNMHLNVLFPPPHQVTGGDHQGHEFNLKSCLSGSKLPSLRPFSWGSGWACCCCWQVLYTQSLGAPLRPAAPDPTEDLRVPTFQGCLWGTDL